MSSLNSRTIDSLMLEERSRLHRWTVGAYHRLSEMGILAPEQRTELIAGQILLMLAKGTPHVVALELLASRLRTQLGDRALVRTQDPIQLDDYSEPEPDLALVQGGILDYLDHHPRPAQVYLVVEVADSTLRYDCEVKAKAYAQAGIPDYWVLDVSKRQLHLFRDPTVTGYSSHTVLTEPSLVSLLNFANLTLSLSGILPPPPQPG